MIKIDIKIKDDKYLVMKKVCEKDLQLRLLSVYCFDASEPS
jgi:hypothetical protein